MTVDKRQKLLLKFIVEEYTKTALPVGSESLCNKPGLRVSSATVRNEMAALEEKGLICQPHTSAGRVPTEAGYRFYLENYKEQKAPVSYQNKIKAVLRSKLEQRFKLKELAKALAEITGETVILAFGKQDTYYTGITNLFSKPELLERQNVIYDLSEVIDSLDEVVGDFFEAAPVEPQILLGNDNPFDKRCGSVVLKNKGVLIIILGLLRMNYNLNLSLLKYIKNKI